MADLGAIGDLWTDHFDEIELAYVSPPVAQLTMTISGTIYDDTSTATDRLVRVYRRSDGQLIGETTSDAGDGTYEVACPDEEVQRIALDDDAGDLYNDIIDRVIPG